MIHILSWTTKNHQKTLARPLHSKLKKIQGLSKDLHRNLRTFQGLFETARTLSKIGLYFTQRNGPILELKQIFLLYSGSSSYALIRRKQLGN